MVGQPVFKSRAAFQLVSLCLVLYTTLLARFYVLALALLSRVRAKPSQTQDPKKVSVRPRARKWLRLNTIDQLDTKIISGEVLGGAFYLVSG